MTIETTTGFRFTRAREAMRLASWDAQNADEIATAFERGVDVFMLLDAEAHRVDFALAHCIVARRMTAPDMAEISDVGFHVLPVLAQHLADGDANKVLDGVCRFDEPRALRIAKALVSDVYP